MQSSRNNQKHGADRGSRQTQYLRKVSRQSPKIRIPKRGRIRIVLACVCLLLVYQFFFRKGCSPSNPLPKPSSLSQKDVRALLAAHPPRLDRSRDTVSVGGENAVMFYSVQEDLQRLGQELLNRYHPQYAAIAAVEVSTGRLLTLISYENPKAPGLGKRLFCRNAFPAASIFKTVVAATALESGKLKGASLLDHVGNRHTLYRFQLQEKLRGAIPVTLEDAFAYSINPIFGRIGLYVVSVNDIRTSAERFGFNAPPPFELDVDSSTVMMDCDSVLSVAELASGFNQETRLTPVSGALIAAAIAGDGTVPRPILVDSIRSADGRVLFKNTPSTWKRAVHWDTALQLRQMMRSVVAYGTARRSFRNFKQSRFSRDVECGGKTGSVTKTGLGRVDWFVGYGKPSLSGKSAIALGIVTVHDEYWTVHSSYIASELILRYLRQTGKEAESTGATTTRR